LRAFAGALNVAACRFDIRDPDPQLAAKRFAIEYLPVDANRFIPLACRFGRNAGGV
jgi:hypothetical protein